MNRPAVLATEREARFNVEHLPNTESRSSHHVQWPAAVLRTALATPLHEWTAKYDPCASKYDPCATKYDHCAAKYEPCAAKCNPCGAKHDPCAAKYDPCATKYDPCATKCDPCADSTMPMQPNMATANYIRRPLGVTRRVRCFGIQESKGSLECAEGPCVRDRPKPYETPRLRSRPGPLCCAQRC